MTDILVESGDGPEGVVSLDDVARRAAFMAYDIAAHSGDVDAVQTRIVAHEAAAGGAAHLVTRAALEVLTVQIVEQLYAAAPGVEAFVRPELARQAQRLGEG